MIKIFAPILVSILLISGAFFIGKDYGKTKEISNCQQQQIINQNEDIKIIAKSVENRKINNLIDFDDDLLFLQEYNCSDCK